MRKFAFAILFLILFLILGCIEQSRKVKIVDLGCKKSLDSKNISAIYENNTIKINMKITYYCSEITFDANYFVNGSKIKIFYEKNATPTRCICTHDVEITIENLTGECYQIEIYDSSELFGKVNVGKKKCPEFVPPSPNWYDECKSKGGIVVSRVDECGCSLPPECKLSECVDDSDCAIGGCSGEICANKEIAKEIVTPCIWKEEYACFKLTSCGCVDGKCKWKENKEFLKCIQS
jgi:eight-cysteine-cluster-containing protein